MPELKRNGQPTLNYEIDDCTDPWRAAPTLLLQHGFSRSANIWYQWVPYLSRHFRVVRLDLRGFGKSSKDFDLKKDLTTEHLLSDVVALIDHLGGEPIHYCGESLGGILGMMLAARHPEKLRTLSVLASPLKISESTKVAFSCGLASWPEAIRTLGSTAWSAKANNATRFPPGTDPKLLDWYAKETGKSDSNVLSALAETASTMNITACLSQITTPTLGIYPGNGIVTREDEAMIEATIKGMRMVRLPTEYHAIQFFMPATCATEVLHFATQFDGTTSREQ